MVTMFGMVQRGGGAGLLDEAAMPLGIAGASGWKQLDGGAAAEAGIDGAVDDPHAAAADFFLDLIVRNDHQGDYLTSVEEELGFTRVRRHSRARKSSCPRPCLNRRDTVRSATRSDRSRTRYEPAVGGGEYLGPPAAKV